MSATSLWLALAIGLAGAGAAAAEAGGLDPNAERDRIASERRAVEARYAAEEAGCSQRFAVTACVDEARHRRHAALQDLRAQQLVLNDAERKRRAAARMQAIEAKRIDGESRPPEPPAPASTPHRAAAPAGKASAPALEVRRPRLGADAAEAAERAAAGERRRAEAAAEQARIGQRASERAASGKKAAAPLPLPPEFAPSAPHR